MIIGALVPSLLYFRHKFTSTEDQKQGPDSKSSDSKDLLLVLPTPFYRHQPDNPLFVFNPFKTSDEDFLTTFNIKYEIEEEIYPSCSVVWENNMLLFGNQITMLNGCKLSTQYATVWFFIKKIFNFNTVFTTKKTKKEEDSLTLLEWYGNFMGVCTTVQDTIMLCFAWHYYQKECYQFKPTFVGGTNRLEFKSSRKVTDTLYTHGHGTKIASIKGNLTI